MDNHRRTRHGVLTRSATGPSAAEAFILIAIATILITRLYLQLTGYPQVGGGNLHIAHALYGGALMMLALLIGWMTLGFGARILAVVLGGIGFGLFLDEVGKFVTKDNDYFYGPAAEIMYILVVVILVGARIVRDFRPLTPQECLASAAAIAADGVARGLADHRRQIALELVEQARVGGADIGDVHSVRALLTVRRPRARPVVPTAAVGPAAHSRLLPQSALGARCRLADGCRRAGGPAVRCAGHRAGRIPLRARRHHAAAGRGEPRGGHPAHQRGADVRDGAAGDDRRCDEPTASGRCAGCATPR